MNKRYLLVGFQSPGHTFFGPEEDAAAAAAAAANGGQQQGNPNPDPAGTSGGVAKPPLPALDANDPRVKALIQTEVNKANANEKRTWQQRNQELANQLQTLKENSQLTEQQKIDLENQIETLRQSYQTEEQKNKTALQKAEDKYKKDTAALETTSKGWQSRFEQHKVTVDISKAAEKYKAFSTDQIAAILRPLTKVVQKTDAEGKPMDDFITQVDFEGRDKEGKPVMLKLSVEDAVKTMTEIPDLYGNLFQTDSKSGTGAQPNTGTMGSGNGRIGNIDEMDSQDYLKNREAIRKKLREAQG